MRPGLQGQLEASVVFWPFCSAVCEKQVGISLNGMRPFRGDFRVPSCPPQPNTSANWPKLRGGRGRCKPTSRPRTAGLARRPEQGYAPHSAPAGTPNPPTEAVITAGCLFSFCRLFSTPFLSTNSCRPQLSARQQENDVEQTEQRHSQRESVLMVARRDDEGEARGTTNRQLRNGHGT